MNYSTQQSLLTLLEDRINSREEMLKELNEIRNDFSLSQHFLLLMLLCSLAGFVITIA